jgi:hypothetical protein
VVRLKAKRKELKFRENQCGWKISKGDQFWVSMANSITESSTTVQNKMLVNALSTHWKNKREYFTTQATYEQAQPRTIKLTASNRIRAGIPNSITDEFIH